MHLSVLQWVRLSTYSKRLAGRLKLNSIWSIIGVGKRLYKIFSQIELELWFPWQHITPIGLEWGNLVSTLAPQFVIGSSLFLQVTSTTIKSRTGMKLCKIQLSNAEFAVLERLEKSPHNGRNFVSNLVPLFLGESSSLLLATSSTMKAWMSWNFC